MGSINAENVALAVLEKVGKGEKPILGQIIKDHGYSDSVSRHPQKVTETLSYINAMDKHIQRMQNHANKILKAMESKDLNSEDYRVLSESYSRMRKDMLLAQGKSTENVAVSINVIDYTNSDV